jgi:hypothetical protein
MANNASSFFDLFPDLTGGLHPSAHIAPPQRPGSSQRSGPAVSSSGSLCLGEKRSSRLCFSENGRKCLYLVKLVSFEWQLEIESILYEFLSEKCVQSEYAIHIPVCISHHVGT